eukprot:CAMPEP_0172607934 /NCGR_PEP_ID=MMETSP1068-20121228/28056_1 /TAXON_ID=35684 /ORGANISM="Pseudopedinella elastica, Strain CCMP716" /LENGTH=367 /DNA_ID=CAMNT_0013411063 /DNA_START=206 /DNA_END=1309 /DNA_ORIENTATION=+
MPARPNYKKVSRVAPANTAPITIEIAAGQKAGFTWGDGGIVDKVTKGGLSEKAGVQLKYRLIKVNEDAVSTELRKKDVEALLVAARTESYFLTFASKEVEIKLEAEEEKAAALAAEDVAKKAEEERLAAEAAAAAEARTKEAAEAEAKKKAEEEGAAAAAEEMKAKKAEEARLAAEAAAAEEAAAKEEEERQKAWRNGNVTILYNMYNDPFEIKDGSLTAAAIDEEYCLTDVMPGCQIHLSRISPEEFTKLSQLPEYGADFEVKYEKEEPWGVFQDLETVRKYYVWVVQDPKQQEKERQKMKSQWEKAQAAEKVVAAQKAEEAKEGCSCVDGMPCMDPYICLDWENRVAVACKHGFKPEKIKVWNLT